MPTPAPATRITLTITQMTVPDALSGVLGVGSGVVASALPVAGMVVSVLPVVGLVVSVLPVVGLVATVLSVAGVVGAGSEGLPEAAKAYRLEGKEVAA